jgi:hypothetical protein
VSPNFFHVKLTILSLDKLKPTAIRQQFHGAIDAQNASAIQEIHRIL